MKKDQILGLVRHTLTFVGGILVAKGLVSEGVVTDVVGAVLTLVGSLWSVMAKA